MSKQKLPVSITLASITFISGCVGGPEQVVEKHFNEFNRNVLEVQEKAEGVVAAVAPELLGQSYEPPTSRLKFKENKRQTVQETQKIKNQGQPKKVVVSGIGKGAINAALQAAKEKTQPTYRYVPTQRVSSHSLMGDKSDFTNSLSSTQSAQKNKSKKSKAATDYAVSKKPVKNAAKKAKLTTDRNTVVVSTIKAEDIPLNVASTATEPQNTKSAVLEAAPRHFSDPGIQKKWLLRAEAYLYQGNLQEAADILNSLYDSGAPIVDRKRYEGIRAWMKNIQSMMKDATQSQQAEQDLEQNLVEEKELISKENISGSQPRYREVLKLQPDNTTALEGISTLRKLAKKKQQVRESTQFAKTKIEEKAEKADPKNNSDWVVQLHTFSEAEKVKAYRLLTEARQAGVEAFVKTSTTGAKKLYRVRVGPYPTKEAAERMKEQVIQKMPEKGKRSRITQ